MFWKFATKTLNIPASFAYWKLPWFFVSIVYITLFLMLFIVIWLVNKRKLVANFLKIIWIFLHLEILGIFLPLPFFDFWKTLPLPLLPCLLPFFTIFQFHKKAKVEDSSSYIILGKGLVENLSEELLSIKNCKWFVTPFWALKFFTVYPRAWENLPSKSIHIAMPSFFKCCKSGVAK